MAIVAKGYGAVIPTSAPIWLPDIGPDKGKGIITYFLSSLLIRLFLFAALLLLV